MTFKAIGMIAALALVVGIAFFFIVPKVSERAAQWPLAALLGLCFAPALIVLIIAVVVIAVNIRREYIELDIWGMTFHSSKGIYKIPWSDIRRMRAVEARGRFGSAFRCYIVSTGDRELCFADTGGMPEDWLPDNLRTIGTDRVFVDIRDPGSLRDAMVSTGSMKADGDGTWVPVLERKPPAGRPMERLVEKPGGRLRPLDLVFAFVLTAILPCITIALVGRSLPWSAPPEMLGDAIYFRYSVKAYMVTMGGAGISMYILPLVGFAAGAVVGQVLRRQGRIGAWMIFIVIAGLLTVLLGLYMPRGYSRDSFVRLGTQKVEIHEVSRDGKVVVQIPLAAVREIQVHKHFPKRAVSYVGRQPEAGSLSDSDSGRLPERHSRGYLIIHAGDGKVKIPNTIEGFDLLIKELEGRAKLDRAAD